ncbi:MAG: yehT 2 [Paenibacillaceae bacterium]|jgi:two-component SAPR family response regulator|nr:yehT 2 [Paenibacillaceae bacterium]
MLKAYLVDDELHALNMLELFLHRTGKVEVVGRSINGFDGLQALDRMRPQVWFLDIEMPGMTGLELAEKIHAVDPDAVVIFVTAYDQYAIAAFELAAIDYLLKPIEMDRLILTVDRIAKGVQLEASRAAACEEPGHQGLEVLEVRLLGAFQAVAPTGKTLAWRTAKEKELFIFLLLHKGSSIHRDRIIEMLWTDEPYEKAKIYLHTCISLLRKHLRQLGFEQMIRYEKECYELNPLRIQTDVQLFQSLHQRRQHSSEILCNELEFALQQYKGELLANEDYPWSAELSRQLEQMALDWMVELAGYYLEQGEGRKAMEMAERAMAHSPFDEEAYRLAMRAYLFTGKYDYVQKVYSKLEQQLAELDIKPSKQTRNLYNSFFN